METSHLQELIDLEEGYWWHVAKRRLVVELLTRHFPPPGRLIEGGIGSAQNLLEFQRLGYEVTGFDVMDESVEHARDRGIADVHRQDLCQPWPMPAGSVRAVVLLDVLEHVPDPVAVLRHAAETLQSDGGVIVTVPAHRWLFGAWDRRLGHYRRYSSREFATHVQQAGLRLDWLSYWNSFTLPAALVVRGMDRILARDRATEFPRVPAVMNRMLIGSARLERSWMRRNRVPLGLSLVGVLKK